MDPHLPHQHVVEITKGIWSSANASWDPISWVFRLIGASQRADAVFVVEYGSGDWERAHCTGEPDKIWKYAGSDFVTLEELPELDHGAIATKTPVVEYCLNHESNRMIQIIFYFYGYRAGSGIVLEKQGGAWIPKGPAWRS